MNFPELLCTKSAARILDLSHRTLENYRQMGKGPCYLRLGGRMVRYRKADLLEWMDEVS